MRKALQLAPLALLVWLAGCASTTGPATTAAPVPPAAPANPSLMAQPPAPLPAVIPDGPLSPIAAAQAESQGVAALMPPADLWQRIRGGFALPDLDSPLVRQHEQWYATRPDYIERMTERSRKYLFHIVEELERRNMPAELALLPFIESAFNPQAVSSARAAGMWQFMPATGTYFELKQNVFRDDRRAVLDSTRAALDYLQKLHGMFGDWHLALAAYNWGEGNVGRAIRRNKLAGLGTAYTDLSMPAETRNYVPKLQAVKNIVATPEKFSAELPVIENHPYFQTVTITRDIDVELAAKLADVRLEDFKALNPQHNRPVILASVTPQILLPWDNANVFKRNFEGYTSGRYASWTAWTAPATMSAGEAARRVGMNEADFRAVNNIPPRMMIRAGSVVLAPRNGAVLDDVAGHVAENAQLRLAPETPTRRTVVRARKRDSVASIASRYRLPVAQVAAWNNLSANSVFKPGQRVVVYLPVRKGKVRRAPRATPRASVRPAIKSTQRRPAASTRSR